MHWVFILLIFLWSCRESEESSRTDGGIISLAPHITEIIYAIDAEDRLLGITDYCNYPPEVRGKERVGGFLNPNIEKIVALNPGMAIGIPSHMELSKKINPFRIRTIMLPNETVADILQTIDSVGVITGRQQEALKLQNSIRDSINSYAKTLTNPPGAMLVIGREKGTSRNITVAGPGTFIHELWTGSGGRNVFDDVKSCYTMISREAVLMRNPEIIIEFYSDDEIDPQREKSIREEWNHFKDVQAVRNGKIFIVSGNYCMIPGPRMYLLARDFASVLTRSSG